jgi:DNA-binding NarL/FixJ family response regulator
MKKIKLAIAEDSVHYRKAIVRLLSLEQEFEFMMLVSNGVELLQRLKTETPDIILMDIRMPEMDGITATNHVRELYPKIKIIGFSQYDFESNIVKMYISGVRSFVSKEDDPRMVAIAIKEVFLNGLYINERTLAIIQKNLSFLDSNPRNVTLTDQEKTIIDMIMVGMTSKQIGEKLSKSHRTIEDTREKLYEKLGVNNKLELVSIMYRKYRI